MPLSEKIKYELTVKYLDYSGFGYRGWLIATDKGKWDHREDGHPAVIYANGSRIWIIDNQEIRRIWRGLSQ